MIGQLAVVHHLQQHVVKVRMGLLDLVEQHHAMRMLVNAIGQQPALIEPDIARRRPEQSADRVPLHIFGHVEAQQFNTERVGQLLGNLCLAYTSGTGKQIRTDRLLRFPQAGTRQLDGRRQRGDGVILPEHYGLEALLQSRKQFGIRLGHRFGRDARN